MLKKIIPILGVATAIAAFCLVAFQLFWIREARSIKEEEFNSTVNSTLDQLIANMEKNEVAFYIANDVVPENSYVFKNYKSGIRSQQKNQQLLTVNLDDTTSVSKRFAPVADPVIAKQLYEKLVTIDKQQREQAKRDPESVKLNEKLNYKKVLVDNIVEKIISLEVPIEQRVSQPQLDSLIRSEFRNRGLNLAFDFSVHHANGDFLFGSKQHDITANKDVYVRQLFPNDLLSERYFLSISFPRKNSYILLSMGVTLFTSLGLLIIVLGVFFGTLMALMRQKKLSQIRNDFVSNMTHELKTPIATIALASEMLSDTSVPNEKKNFVTLGQVIHAQTKRLSMLVERTLQLAMFESGRMRLRTKRCDFHNMANRVIDGFSLQAQSAGANIARAFNASNAFIDVDEVHFSNIFSNLIDNALKYSKQDPLIVVSTKNVDNQLLIQVRDNGIGIPKDDLKRVFEQFYRVHTGNLHNVKGFGLGLSYVKKIVEEQGGTISVDSEIGKGSTFSILMPLSIKNQR